MRKKVVDIFYPKESEKKEAIQELKKEPSFVSTKIEYRTPGSSAPRKILIFGLGILILAFVFCFFTLSKANIEIWPETDSLFLKTELIIDGAQNEANFQNKVIPGKIFEKEQTVNENFPASGKTLKEGKAEGTVRVYNTYSTASQVFVAGTRFVSSDGRVFRTPVRVTIPGGYYEKGKLIAGEVDIKVVAEAAGPEYNIGPTTFSIPGLAGTEKYTKFYAESSEQFKGGFSQGLSQVTKEDLEKAKDTLTKKAKEECEASIKSELQSAEISSEFNFLEKAVQTEIVETFSLAQVGDTVENFNYQVKAKTKTLLFSKEELKNFAEEFIKSQISGKEEEGLQKRLYEESLEVTFVPETINLNSNKILLSLGISAKIYSDIDLANFKNNLKGKSSLETKLFLESQPGVVKIEVELWPFWVRKVPENLDEINLQLRVD